MFLIICVLLAVPGVSARPIAKLASRTEQRGRGRLDAACQLEGAHTSASAVRGAVFTDR
jgi:hypothetical protein